MTSITLAIVLVLSIFKYSDGDTCQVASSATATAPTTTCNSTTIWRRNIFCRMYGSWDGTDFLDDGYSNDAQQDPGQNAKVKTNAIVSSFIVLSD